MLDRDEEAMEIFAKVPSLISNKANRFSKIAVGKTQRVLEKRFCPFIAFEFLYLRRDLAHMEEIYLKKALQILDQLCLTVSNFVTLTYILERILLIITLYCRFLKQTMIILDLIIF